MLYVGFVKCVPGTSAGRCMPWDVGLSAAEMPSVPFNNTGGACVECAVGVCHGSLAETRPVGGVLITATIYPRSPQTKFHSLPFNATSKYLGGRASCWLWSVEVGARY